MPGFPSCLGTHDDDARAGKTCTMNSLVSHEESPKAKAGGAVPFILDKALRPPQSPPPVAPADTGALVPNSSAPTTLPATTPPRSHRAQTTAAVVHHSLRPVPEEPSVPVIPDHTTSPSMSASPRRPRATTALSKPRSSVERVSEEDASWWTEEIHKRREMRRRMREVEVENIVIIGNKVDSNHPNYVTAYNMLTGLRVAVMNSVQATQG